MTLGPQAQEWPRAVIDARQVVAGAPGVALTWVPWPSSFAVPGGAGDAWPALKKRVLLGRLPSQRRTVPPGAVLICGGLCVAGSWASGVMRGRALAVMSVALRFFRFTPPFLTSPGHRAFVSFSLFVQVFYHGF